MSDANGIRPLAEVMAEAEKDYLVRALRAANGRRQVCATALKISRKSLWQKIRAYGISGFVGREDDEPAAAVAEVQATPEQEPHLSKGALAAQGVIDLVGNGRVVVVYSDNGDAVAFGPDELGLVIAHVAGDGDPAPSTMYLQDEVLPDLIEAAQKALEAVAAQRAARRGAAS